MRVLKFDRLEADALRGLGFEISDGDEAKFSGHITVSAIRPDGDEKFLLTISFPGGTFDCVARRAAVLATAGDSSF